MIIVDNFPTPYYVVVFTSVRTPQDAENYSVAAQQMLDLASRQPGFLGVESVRGEDGVGITVSYWASEEAVVAWRDHPEHQAIRERGRSTWYQHFTTRVARVERSYSYSA